MNITDDNLKKLSPNDAVDLIATIIRKIDIFDSPNSIHLLNELLNIASHHVSICEEYALSATHILSTNEFEKKIISRMVNKKETSLSITEAFIIEILESDLIEVCNVGGIVNTSLYSDFHFRKKGLNFPISISKCEIEILLENVLKKVADNSCFLEIGTGFGFSSSAMGYLLQKLNKNVDVFTIDSFVESGNDDKVIENRLSVQENTLVDNEAYNTAVGLHNHLGLDNVHIKVGVSPFIFDKLEIGLPVSAVFIDGGHFYDQPLKDFKAIQKYIDEKTIVILHDTQAESVERLKVYLVSLGYKLNHTNSSCRMIIACI